MSPRLQHRFTFLARCATPLYAILIVVLSLLPGDEVPLAGISDKYRHAAAYGVFAVLLGCSFAQLRYWTLLLAFVTATLVGVLMEITQPYFGRSRDVYDALANSIGALLGCAVVFVILITLTRRTNPSAIA